jgi:hypothetical protein
MMLTDSFGERAFRFYTSLATPRMPRGEAFAAARA